MNVNKKILAKSYLEGQLVAQKIMKRIPEDYAHSPGINLRSKSQSDFAYVSYKGDSNDSTKQVKKSSGTIIPRENKNSLQRMQISNKFKVYI